MSAGQHPARPRPATPTMFQPAAACAREGYLVPGGWHEVTVEFLRLRVSSEPERAPPTVIPRPITVNFRAGQFHAVPPAAANSTHECRAVVQGNRAPPWPIQTSLCPSFDPWCSPRSASLSPLIRFSTASSSSPAAAAGSLARCTRCRPARVLVPSSATASSTALPKPRRAGSRPDRAMPYPARKSRCLPPRRSAYPGASPTRIVAESRARMSRVA